MGALRLNALGRNAYHNAHRNPYHNRGLHALSGHHDLSAKGHAQKTTER